ncbi:hypothetical protein SDJN02_11653, partial [Cucurbita argyrosperma subsp. argyrosperma]
MFFHLSVAKFLSGIVPCFKDMTAKLTSKVVPSYSSLDSASLNYCLIHIGALSAAAVGGHVGVARAGVVVAESARRHAAATTTACAACPVA